MKSIILPLNLSLLLISGCTSLGIVKEVNDSAMDSPYPSTLIENKKTVAMPEGYLASGLTYDWDSNEYIMLSDHPHGQKKIKVSTLMVVDGSLSNVVSQQGIPSESDIEGLSYYGNGMLYAISEAGIIYTFSKEDGIWSLNSTLPGTSGTSVKVSSMAIDTDNDVIYTAEKKGNKNLYRLDVNGNLIDTISLHLPDNPKNANINKDFTISGLAYENGKLLVLSEAYSTVFVYSIAENKIIDAIGLHNTHEMSGITLNASDVITAGDFEDYLPSPVFSTFDKSLFFKN